MRYSSFDDIVERGERVLKLLADRGVNAKPGSVLLRYLASTREAQRTFASGEDVPDVRAGELVRDLANLSILSNGILLASPRLLERAHSHLQAIVRGEPGPLTPGARSQARSFAFELLCASACDRFAADTNLAEPDVTCTFQCANWGLACKTISGNAETSVSAIRTGIDQLVKSPCDHGLVVLQITDIFPHLEMRRRHVTEADLKQRLTELVVRTARPIVELAQKRFDMYQNWPSQQVRAVLFLAHSIGYLDKAHVLGTGELRAFHSPRRADLEDRFAAQFQRALEGLY